MISKSSLPDTEQVRAAWQARLRGFAEVEKIIYREKCTTLPLLSIEEGLRQFIYLYEMALAFGHAVQRHPALEERHIAETLAIRQRFVQASGRKPSG